MRQARDDVRRMPTPKLQDILDSERNTAAGMSPNQQCIPRARFADAEVLYAECICCQEHQHASDIMLSAHENTIYMIDTSTA